MPGTDHLWYKDAVIYEVHVRSFYDSDGDGIGDLRGLTEKLDYIEGLGVTAIWLLPFYPSPLKDDGYDIAGYTEVHPDYGTLKDFEELLAEAHRRGLKVITELVLNHTSDQHPWFQRARRAPVGSVERDFYVWSDDPTKYKDARIIFADTKLSNWTWDPLANQYFWHRFYGHQPDLNFDNPQVQKAVMEVVDFWLSMGIDGMRLDAITYLFEREGTNCEGLPETHAFLKDLRSHIDQRFPNRMLLAEANQWPEDAADYFGGGQECHMTFHFPLMPRLFMAVQMEDRFPIVDILEQTPEIPYECQWAIFLRNHDELTLEMVTDEERDLMYRAFAPETRMRINLGIRRRLAPLLHNDRRKIHLMYSLLFSLGGTPILYYGDELGMGDNYHLGDRDGVRTPMQWSPDLNAGFSRANPQSLFLPVVTDPEYHYIATNVQTQENNPTSLLQWVKRLLAIRQRYRCLGRGDVHFVPTNNHKVLAFVRSEGSELVLVVTNLSRSVQHVVLDLERFEGLWPLELWGRTEFPRIEGKDYGLSLGPYSGYWFSLERQQASLSAPSRELERLPNLEVKHDWTAIFEGRLRGHFQEHLRAHIVEQSWFVARGRSLESIEVTERIRLRLEGEQAILCLVDARFLNGDSELFVLPIACAFGRQELEIRQQSPEAAIAPIFVEGEEDHGLIFDAFAHRGFCRSLAGLVRRSWDIQGLDGTLRGEWLERIGSLTPEEVDALEPSLIESDESSTTITFGQSLVMKISRRIERGPNLDVEVGRYLLERGYPNAAALCGQLAYRRGRWEPMTVATLHEYVPNQGDGWSWALGAQQNFFARLADFNEPLELPEGGATRHLMALGAKPPSTAVDYLVGPALGRARSLGQRTAELHATLATAPADSPFAAELFTPTYERARFQSMRTLAVRAARMLRTRFDKLPEPLKEPAGHILASQEEMLKRFRALVGRGIGGLRTRIHGDLHLRDVLATTDDFVFIDLEGHPWLPIGERRIKRSPLWDVASMLRSFHNASLIGLNDHLERQIDAQAQRQAVERGARLWFMHIGAAYLNGYLQAASGHAFLPTEPEAIAVFLDALLLEKALYQLEREFQQDPRRVDIPIAGIMMLLE
ncbi:MAG: maltose alpha-D-glucosyltransferase [Bradymonadaceae bacterium]|nr:maltose alpha-D-glucosyltransferase [Lujinxingiaceae bacterium]